MEYLYIEKIVSNDIINLPFSVYEALNLYIVYINQKNGNIIYNKESKKYIDIKSAKLFVGLKTLIELHAVNKNISITVDLLGILTNILEIAGKDKIDRKYLLDHLFSLIETFRNQIKDNQKNACQKIALKRILRLISIINKTKVTKNMIKMIQKIY